MSLLRGFRFAAALAAYLVLLTLLLPLLPLRLLWRSRRAPGYRRRMGERFGFGLPRPRAGGIWVHAVSVGETFAAESTIREMLARYPGRPVTVTSTTPTGSAQVQRLFGDAVHHCYAPYDWPLFVWLFLRRVRPDLLVIMETELWPITLLLCRALGVDVLLANARLSEKSARGYRKVAWLLEPSLKDVYVAAQHESDAGRLLALGAQRDRLSVTGSVKFDVSVDDAMRAEVVQLRDAIRGNNRSPVWIAASTHEGEEVAALEAHSMVRRRYPDALLIVVPRHPERFSSVAKAIGDAGFSQLKRSDSNFISRCGSEVYNVLMVDTLGELMLFYGVADLAFVGGSLAPVGGHNYLEPACWGLPVVSGPHTHNFANIARQLHEVGALEIVKRGEALGAAVCDWLEREADRQSAAAAMQQLLQRNRGASARLIGKIEGLLPHGADVPAAGDQV